MADTKLQNFYEAWSSKSADEIDHDIEGSVRKAEVIASALPPEIARNIRSILDFGCGYGAFLQHFQSRLGISKGLGVDFSESAIKIANEKFKSESLRFFRLETLDTAENVKFLDSIAPEGVDAVSLIDLLEHVPDCKTLVSSLAKFTKYFIIKLPVESSLFDNYVLPKEYPSSVHSNGHLREFDANNVYYFIRQIGLTPLYETLYVYHPRDAFPPCPATATFKQRVVRGLIVAFKRTASWLLPKKFFLRLVGGGGYFCIATFEQSHILNP
jgi:ubiquinone/menaquinone biosynthesis C-methylase UbiE